jgi:hypothetical protein
MKKMLLIVALLAATMSYGQKKATISYNAGVQVNVPMGALANDFKYGIGGLVSANCKPGKTWTYSLTAGYLSYQAKTGIVNVSQIPVLVGANYPIAKAINLGAEAGVSFFNNGIGSRMTVGGVLSHDINSKFNVAVRYTSTLKNSTDVDPISNGSITVFYKL